MQHWELLCPGGLSFVCDDGLFQPSTDSFLLGSFPRLKPGLRVCDLGSGTGLLGLLLFQRQRALSVTGVELLLDAVRLAEQAAARNGLADRLIFRRGDLRKIRGLLPAGGFDLVVCNPPYYPAGSGRLPETEALRAARSETGCTLEDICTAAAWLLRCGGLLPGPQAGAAGGPVLRPPGPGTGAQAAAPRLPPGGGRPFPAAVGGPPGRTARAGHRRPPLPGGRDRPPHGGAGQRLFPNKGDERMSGTLYLVATPIGNLGDFSPRAAETLGAVDFIAAEDTRVSVKLLNHFQIKKPLVSYHEHNHAAAGQAILQRLLAGESCALVTDAGTPAISDPGEDLVRLCAENGVEVLSIPGCCAAVNALAVSGLPTGRFTFEGFITVNKKSRRERLDSLKNEERTMIFHEAPHKLRATLEDLRETFGPDRRVALCRELTKLHEETVRTTLGEAAAYYQENTPKGEYVLVVAGSPPRETAAVTLEEGTEQVLRLVAQGIRLKDAAREVSAHTGLSKNELYAAALERS